MDGTKDARQFCEVLLIYFLAQLITNAVAYGGGGMEFVRFWAATAAKKFGNEKSGFDRLVTR
jgi:hypothetical protein